MTERLPEPAAHPQLPRAQTVGVDVPAYRYWNDDTNAWGRFDEATRYPTGEDPPLPSGPRPDSRVEWVADLPRDLDGHPYVVDESIGPWRVTACCAAMVSISDGPLYCKSCFAEADLADDTPARLDANWRPGDGPVRFLLP